MKYIERKCCDILLTGKLVPDNFRAYPEEFHSHILYKLQSLIETYLKDIQMHILYGKWSFFYKLFLNQQFSNFQK